MALDRVDGGISVAVLEDICCSLGVRVVLIMEGVWLRDSRRKRRHLSR
jgi:hypothetical protein